MDVLEYERLIADFEAKLVTQLRSFGADADYLEMWVPDDDPVKSILNMVEAAEAYGRDEMAVRVGSKIMTPERLTQLTNKIGDLGEVESCPEGDQVVIVVTKIGQQ